MKISDARIIILSVPLETATRVSFGTMNARTTAIIRIETDEGISGIGESWINFPSWGWKERVATFEEGVKPLLIGRDPLDLNRLMKELFDRLLTVGRQWGAPGIVYQTLSGVDIALWDILGRHLGAPVHTLLGGNSSSRSVPYYASGIDVLRGEQEINAWYGRGCRAFKLRVGFDSERESQIVRDLARQLLPDATLMIDANQKWSPSEAVRYLQRIEDAGLGWIEEPVACDDIAGAAAVRSAQQTPVAAGENAYGERAFLELLRGGAVDIIQPDVTKSGGISAARDAAIQARAWGIPFAPHTYGSAVGLVASMHLLGALPTGLMLELDSTENPLQTRLLQQPVALRADKAVIPAGSGLGIELDQEFIEKHSIR